MADRYLGNKNTDEVHDTENENTNCQLSEIKDEHKDWFASLTAAHNAGYDDSAWCLPGSTR